MTSFLTLTSSFPQRGRLKFLAFPISNAAFSRNNVKIVSLLDWCLFTGLLSLMCLSGLTPLGYSTAKSRNAFSRHFLACQQI